jgi:ATP-binding cassette subfamily B multidrug efflux pump
VTALIRTQETRAAPLLPRGPFSGPPVHASKDITGATRRLVRRLAPEKLSVLAMLLLAATSVGLTVLGPKVLGHATDILVKGVVAGTRIDLTSLRNVLVVVLALYLSASGFAWLQSYVLAGVVQRTMFRLRSDVEAKLHRLPLSYVDATPRGDLLSRVTNDMDNLAQSMQQTLSQLFTGLLTIVGVTVMMLVISPILAVFALVLIPLSVAMVRSVSKRSRRRFAAQWMHTGMLNAQVEETFTGHALVKVFGRQAEAEERFRATNDMLFEASFRAQFISGIVQPAMMFLGNLNLVAIAVVGGMRVSSGAMSIGDIQAFIQYSRQFTQPLQQLAGMMNLVQSGLSSAERVFEFLDAPEQAPEAAAPATLPNPTGRVEFTDVSFSYDPASTLIEDLSFVAAPGKTVAIVGPTGAGKTTLVNLIMRFYELNSGVITLDGTDITALSRAELRSKIGMVLQDTWLFAGTIRDNIAYGNLEASEEAILEAARLSRVDRFVHALPDGYQTRLDDDRGILSSGEIQLITIARAFLADPAILILDEATSSVDTRTEVLVQQAMRALRSRRTSFVIAHRLSTIRDADVILVMDAGQIVEQGNHEELLARGGAYCALYDAQFRAPVASPELAS